MNFLKSYLNILVFSSVIFFSCQMEETEIGKSETNSEVDPAAGIYNFYYGIPEVDSIKNVLNRIRNYFESSTTYKIIDDETGEEITDLSELNPNADLFGGGSNDIITLWGYTMGVTYSGMLKVFEITGDESYKNYVLKNMDYYFDHLPYFQKIDSAFGEQDNAYEDLLYTNSLDDCGSMGASLIKTYKITKDERLLPAINHIADYISNKQFRLADGTLARQRPQEQSVWGDDAYMSIPFLAQMGSLTGNKKYFDDAVKQVLQMSGYLFRYDKRLYDHGVNVHSKYDPNYYWARSNGWMIMAINELLDVLPEDYKEREKIIDILNIHVQGIAEHQGGDGLWHNMLDRTDSFLETSSTAMFVYSIAHGINKGWIDHAYGMVAQTGWNALTTRVTEKGEVEGTCWGTTFANDMVYYYHRPTSPQASHGYGPVLFAGAEMIKLLNNESIEIVEGFRTWHYTLKK